MGKIFFIVLALIVFKHLVSLFLVIKNFKKVSYVCEILISIFIFYVVNIKVSEWYIALLVSLFEYFINKLILLEVIVIIKTIAFRLLISFTHKGIWAKLISLIFNKEKVYKTLKVLQKLDYGPRLKHGIPAMANKRHKKTQVRFDRNGFPKFQAFYTYRLAIKDWKKSREAHFYRANKAIYNKALKSKKIRKLFTRKDMQELKKGETPDMYTWHHHQSRGKLQLVSREIHADVDHIGGYSIWGEK